MSTSFSIQQFRKNLETQVYHLNSEHVLPHVYFKLLLREDDVAAFLKDNNIDADILANGIDRELRRKIQNGKNGSRMPAQLKKMFKQRTEKDAFLQEEEETVGIDDFAKELVFDNNAEDALEYIQLQHELANTKPTAMQVFQTMLDPYFDVTLPAAFFAANIVDKHKKLNANIDFGKMIGSAHPPEQQLIGRVINLSDLPFRPPGS